jgi:hypothetical protein
MLKASLIAGDHWDRKRAEPPTFAGPADPLRGSLSSLYLCRIGSSTIEGASGFGSFWVFGRCTLGFNRKPDFDLWMK